MANYCAVCNKKLPFICPAYSVPDSIGKKHNLPICKECLEKVNTQGLSLVYDEASQKVLIADIDDIEIRKKCNVCGNIFCYTPHDLAKNRDEAKKAIGHGLTTIMTAGSTTSAVSNISGENALNRIVDYNKCPKCGSLDLRTLTKEEYQKELQGSTAQSATISAADELKKFKELLDSGVITQDEFDAKKKQLLGL